MKVLIVGSGGREHAIAWKVAQSPKVDKIYCAPGNAGIAEYAECVPISAMEFDKLAAFAKEHEVDLTVIGMDDPLVGGIVDVFEAQGLRVFGPRKNAAILEGSKAFSKDLMKKYGIPTAAYETFDTPEAALNYLETAPVPIVLKADGLALGKGVLICNTREEAKEGVKTLMLDKQFGHAGDRIVVEQFMTGREVSVLSFVDGKTIKIMTSAQDHKRAKDGDQGLNTGGMGTFSPSPFYTDEVVSETLRRIWSDYASPLHISELAAAVHLEENHFIRRFRRAMGQTPYAYLRTYRLALAKQAIASGNTLTQAAEKGGYQNAASLSRALRSAES